MRKPLRRALVVLAGLLGLLLPELVAGISALSTALSNTGHTMVADAPDASRGPLSQGHPAALLVVTTSPVASVSSAEPDPQSPDAPTPVEAPESGLGSVDQDDELNDIDDFAYHLRVFFDGTAQLNRIVEPGMSLGGRALSRLEDDRPDKPPRS